jgi:hypothetical protein
LIDKQRNWKTPARRYELTGVAKRSLKMKKTILKNEKNCRESWILIGRFCFRSIVTEKALEKMGFSQHLTTAVISTRRWAGRDDAELTENVRAQNQLLLEVRIPPVGVHAVLGSLFRFIALLW